MVIRYYFAILERIVYHCLIYLFILLYCYILAVITMLCFCCCCFGAFYCMRSGTLRTMRRKIPNMRFKVIRRVKRPAYEDEEEDGNNGGTVPLEETERS